jgi:hypothetical protein
MLRIPASDNSQLQLKESTMTVYAFRSNKKKRVIALVILSLCCLPALARGETPDEEKPADEAKAKPAKVVKLFDGKTLKGWRVMDKIDFERHGDVKVKDGELILEEGQSMTGISWKGEFPKMDYEVTLEARRIKGYDFFCGMTFPVNKSHCSLILGGWGGSLTGISSIDGFDASENDTTDTMEFKEGQWYKIRLRVTKDKMEAWVDKEQILEFEHKGRQLSLRWEMEDMPPFGLATYETTAGYRNIIVKRL